MKTKTKKFSREFLRIYRHVRAHGASVVGQNALGAFRETKTALAAIGIGMTVSWTFEQCDPMEFAGEPEEEYRRKFKSGEWRALVATCEDAGGNVLASLGGVVVGHTPADRAYMECVEYELLGEAWGTLCRAAA